MSRDLILVAHGTRKSEGVLTIGAIAERVGAVLRRPVRVSFVDVLGPTPSELLTTGSTGGPAIVVPAFLSRGYHVRTDLPKHIIASRHPDVTVTPALGPSPQLAQVVAARLVESGWQPGDSVVLAAAGTSDPTARGDLQLAGRLLSELIDSVVTVAFAATGSPSVAEAVAQLRRDGARRVAVASYLLAEGLFQQRLRDSGADLVAEPLGTHPDIIRLVLGRFLSAHAAAVALGSNPM